MQHQLDARQQAIIPIAAFTATGQSEKLDAALNAGLDAGLTLNEAKEILQQLYAYCGFPRSLNGLACLMSVVKNRRERGITDPEGNPATPPTEGWDSFLAGSCTQTQLVGHPVSGPLFDFAPAIDVWLKAHLFGDIFQRDVLNWKMRELATISALAVLGGVDSQLKSHFAICLNIGITTDQLIEFIAILEQHCGAEIATNARALVDECRG